MRFRLLLTCSVCMSLVSFAQGAPFVNLDFEQATVPPGTGQTIDASLAFPGWTARFGTTALTQVYYDHNGEDAGLISLYDEAVPTQGLPLLQGKYDAYLKTDGSLPTDIPTSLSQTGDVPSDANSIRMLCEGFMGAPGVMLNGTRITMIRVQGDGIAGAVEAYAGDVSMFAGTTADLEISSAAPPPGYGAHLIDDISFSSAQVPEPSIGVLVAVLVIKMSMRRRHG